MTDSDFEDAKSTLYDWLEENELFDDIDEEEEDEGVAEESFSISELLSMCFVDVSSIAQVNDDPKRTQRPETKEEFLLPF